MQGGLSGINHPESTDDFLILRGKKKEKVSPHLVCIGCSRLGCEGEAGGALEGALERGSGLMGWEPIMDGLTSGHLADRRGI